MLELLKTRRSIRKYKNIDVENEKVEAILKAGLLAPSSKNRKPCELLVVKSKETLEKLSICRTKNQSIFLKNANLAILVMANTSITPDVWIEDSAITATLIQLESHSLGLGSCWIQVREREFDENTSTEDYIKKLLNIPSEYAIDSIIAIGYPDQQLRVSDDENLLETRVHFEAF
ncbi:nitroreductase family protein [Clostridium perfringens]|uniref:nitroreductase family protein n=1 Tax=Clostridium perfringens TaxID=1502 RepID=UPI0022484D82|nr:nitroreductase family protein [Clostridium perfringens]MCX0360292.1 nitroreductase family protein [Clostridium perfringens]